MLKRHISFLLFSISGVILFALSFPGLLNNNGIPFLASIALFPLYFIVGKMNYKECIFYGFIYGACTYLLFNYWLKKFDPLSFSILPTIMGFYYVGLFIIIRYIYNNFKKAKYLPLTLMWFVFEFFKGENIIGYTYGTIAHSMYQTPLFTGIADITGTYIISIIIIFPSIFLAEILNRKYKRINIKEVVICLLIYLVILLISIIYTQRNKVDYSNSRVTRISLIQHNIDSWNNNSDKLYKESLDSLIDLSTKAAEDNPELIIWPETAFVPAIEWHKTYKKNSFRLNLVKRLEEFTTSINADFIIGANETIGENIKNQYYYNSAYLYTQEGPVSKYRKITLVPFTENFPFPKQLEWLHKYITKIGGKDITPGKEVVNFKTKDITVTPLICYEDTFSTTAREGILKGGDVIINISNDAWSTEEACSKQHFAAAVFRSIENRRSFARVGTSGFTTIVDPNGKVLSSIPILTRNYLTFDVPVYNNKKTFYTKYGNIFEKMLIIIFLVMSTLSVLQQVMKKILNRALKTLHSN